MLTNLQIYPFRVGYRFGGHKNRKQIISLKYFLDDPLRYGGLQRI